jgi:hypothetical protein
MEAEVKAFAPRGSGETASLIPFEPIRQPTYLRR